MTSRYLTVAVVSVLWPLFLKLMCLVIDFHLGREINILVLLVSKLIVFTLSHGTKSAKSLFMRAFIFLSDLFLSCKLVSSAKW